MDRFRVLQTTHGAGGAARDAAIRPAPSYGDLLREIGRLRALLTERETLMAADEARLQSLQLLNRALRGEHDDIRRSHVEFVVKHQNTVHEITLYHEYFVDLYKHQAREAREACGLLRTRVAREHELCMRFAEALQLVAEEAGCEKRECVVCCDSLYTINTECDHRVCARCFASWHYARNCNDCEMNCPMCRLPVV